ncbi:MAG: STELLO glycosyltransferase family protein [Planctomycetota bacterium]
MLQVVITTIQTPTSCVSRLVEVIAPLNAGLVIAGDTKGPPHFQLDHSLGFDHDRLSFLDIDAQLSTGFSIAEILPTKHYCRKNIGYLQAIRAGATCIYETDDDNMPNDRWFQRNEYVSGCRSVGSDAPGNPEWINVYKHFSSESIWPRGLPLDQINEPSKVTAAQSGDPQWAPIQQGLADGAPDVDAVWRLTMDRDFSFDDSASVMLGPGQWCPFNTQTTWWWPAVYPLLYIPSFCSFRMCDIWKSFVAQRCLWELKTGLVFHAAEVVQERNPHNLMRDFEDEVPGYLQNDQLASCLEETMLTPGVENVGENLRACYQSLVEAEIFPEKELPLVDAWLSDLAQLKPSLSESAAN